MVVKSLMTLIHFLNDYATSIFWYINENYIPYRVVSYIYDTPAQALVKQIKVHICYFSCKKCMVEGEYLNNRMCFTNFNVPKWNDENLSTGVYQDHCKKTHT